MTVVALRLENERRPTLLTLYCVQAYWRDRGALREGKFQQFANMEAALRAGQVAARRSVFVRVYRVRGNVEADYWEEPVTVAKFGAA